MGYCVCVYGAGGKSVCLPLCVCMCGWGGGGGAERRGVGGGIFIIVEVRFLTDRLLPRNQRDHPVLVEAFNCLMPCASNDCV